MARLSIVLLLALGASCTKEAHSVPPGAPERPAAPVEATPLRRGVLVERRTFSGTLEASREFTVASKVSGRLAALHVDVGDRVQPGTVIAEIDDAELVQLVAQAGAELAVAAANHGEAESAHLLAERALRRVESLSQQGITSEAELDNARVTELARRSRIDVTRAQILRVEAALEAARIQSSQARVIADWGSAGSSDPERLDPDHSDPEGSDPEGSGAEGSGAEGSGAEGSGAEGSPGSATLPSDSAPSAPTAAVTDTRTVGVRYVDAGGFVSAGTPLVSVIALDPIRAVITVPERDYAHLRPGMPATLVTDAYPGEAFPARVERLAPLFNRATRQVRVELAVANTDERLKPGMFVRAALELRRLEGAVIAPFAALTVRNGARGLFVLDDEGVRVRWMTVEVLARDGAEVALKSAAQASAAPADEAPSGATPTGPAPSGEALESLATEGRPIVVLGQELCDDGARVRVIPPSPGAPR